MKKIIIPLVILGITVSCAKNDIKSDDSSETVNGTVILDYHFPEREVIDFNKCNTIYDLKSDSFPDEFLNMPAERDERFTYIEELLSADYADSLYLNFYLGSMYYNSGEFDQAYYYFGQVITNSKIYVDNEYYYTMLAYNNLSVYYMNQGDTNHSIELSDASFDYLDYYDKTSVPDNIHSMIYYNRGELLYDMQLFEECQPYFSNAFILCADEANVLDWYQYATSFMMIEKNTEYGITILNTAEQYFPNNASVYFMRGMIQKEISNYKKAISDFMLASFLLSPDSVQLRTVSDQIKVALSKIDASEKDYFLAYFQALAYQQKKSHQEAVDALSELISLNPADPYLYFAIAEEEIYSGNYQSAIAYLDAVKETMPLFSRTYYLYMLAYIGLDIKDLATMNYMICISLDDGGLLTQKLESFADSE